MNRQLRNESVAMARGLAFLSPWLVGFALFTVVPVGLSFYYSFCDYSLLQPPLFKGTYNYATLWNDPVFWKSLRNTLVYGAVALPVGTLVALVAAMLLNTSSRWVAVYRTIVFIPSLVPIVASAMVWLWLFNPSEGLINTVLMALGIDQPPNWLGDADWAMSALVLMSLWGVGNTAVIYLAGLQDVPRELYEAADIDGANPLRKIWHVTLPSISPVIFFNVVMGMIGTLQFFAAPLILTGRGPELSTYFYTMYLYDNAFNYLKMGYASAMAWVQLVIVLVLTALAFWVGRRWVHYSGQ